ncbi:hydroxymethylbilane synthase [Elusimicrobiota bacterium]
MPKHDKRAMMVASRASNLALLQTNLVINLLRRNNADAEFIIKEITTKGDKELDKDLTQISGQGIFIKELEKALLESKCDFAVHSLKDMPTEIASGLKLAAIINRDDPRDALVLRTGSSLEKLPVGVSVGTSSPRRQVQIKALRPDIKVCPLRGNIDTRLRKLDEGEFDAIVLASAGLLRMGLGHRISQYLPVDACLPAVGQGALAVEARSNDKKTLDLLAELDHEATRICVSAERSFLRTLGGGCRAPIAALATVSGDSLELKGMAASPDGSSVVKDCMGGPVSKPEDLGKILAKELLKKGAQDFIHKV